MQTNKHQQGFTLLEILVSVMIFAMIILGAQRIFSLATKSSEALQKEQARLQQIKTTLNSFENDLSQVQARTIRDFIGLTDIQPLQTDINDAYLFRVTRGGWKNPLYRQRPELQAVIYQLKDDQLIRIHTPHLDALSDVNRIEKVLLDGVRAIDIKFLQRNGDWSNGWPLQSTDFQLPSDPDASLPAAANLPIAIEILIELEDKGTLRRMITLAAAA